MDSTIKRPATIWLTQALIIGFALLISSAFLINLLTTLTHFREGIPLIRTLLVYSFMLGLVLLSVIGFWGLVKRRMYGRWLGLIVLVLFWGLLVLISF